jgi:aspartate kinase
VKDAPAVRNVADVLRRFDGEKRVVVVSAMGKTTNALELLHDAWFKGADTSALFKEVVGLSHACFRRGIGQCRSRTSHFF